MDKETRDQYFELELDGFFTSKCVPIPKELIKKDRVAMNAYVREYYESMGYSVGINIRRLSHS